MTATARSIAEQRVRSRDRGRVLMVTDDPAVSFYSTDLESAGLVVVGVAGGAKALVELQRTRPHVVIADRHLKGISADELARVLAHAENNVPLLLVGDAVSTVAVRGAALTAGAFDYFELPAERALLIARVAQLVILKQKIDRLRAEADRDFLTGLSNRRRFRLALTQEVERWRRYNVPCALLLVDIDNLKQINDTFGHPAGDAAICHAASAITAQLRDNDTAARLGGEEFALLLANADSGRAIVAAERLRHAIAERAVDGIGQVTASLGVAACPAHASSERALYAASDAALYRAKHDGKNRVTIAETTPI